MKILLKDDNALSKCYLRYADLLERSNKYDAIINKIDVTDEILNEFKYLLVIERQDSAGIGCRELLKHQHVKTLLKMYYYSDLSLHNGFATGGRIFLDGDDRKLQTPEITPADFAKVQPGFNFIHYDYLTQLFEVLNTIDIKPLDQRKTDLFFAGTVEYGDSVAGKLITAHRKKCVENILKCGERGLNVIAEPGRVFGYKDYIARLLNTKVVLSPFGWGEFCYRDYEAVLCGCLVVKPAFYSVNHLPNTGQMIYRECAFDFFVTGKIHLPYQHQYYTNLIRHKQQEHLIIERILA